MADKPAPEDIAKWQRWFAVECNNRAWRLSEQRSRSGQEDEEMLHCAHAAALHWGRVGTELHRARAAMLLGHVHALLLNGDYAMRYARQAFDYVASHESPAWEIAFAHAVLAHAAAAAQDAELHAEHFARAKSLGDALENAEDRAIFEATFRLIPHEAAARPRFGGLTVQFFAPDIGAGIEFYTRALGRGPNFAPTPDFLEWDHIAPGVTFQLAEGEPRPTYPLRFKVADIALERERVIREARPAQATQVKRFEGLVALCDFIDPWGNAFGLYQVLFAGGEPPKLAGSNRSHMTEVERAIASGAARP